MSPMNDGVEEYPWLNPNVLKKSWTNKKIKLLSVINYFNMLHLL